MFFFCFAAYRYVVYVGNSTLAIMLFNNIVYDSLEACYSIGETKSTPFALIQSAIGFESRIWSIL